MMLKRHACLSTERHIPTPSENTDFTVPLRRMQYVKMHACPVGEPTKAYKLSTSPPTTALTQYSGY